MDDVSPIRDAIAEVVGGAFVENFIVVATTTAPDAEQSINVISDCAHAWQVLGLLAHATEVTRHTKYHEEDK